MKRVKNLKSDRAPWCVSGRPDDAIYLEDSVAKLPGIGGAKEKLLQEKGILLVSDFLTHARTDNKVLTDVRGISQQKVDEILGGVYLDGAPPPTTDHHKQPNPYLSRYGPDDWEQHMNASSMMSRFCCITTLIEHIMTTCATHFKGTQYENDCFFTMTLCP